MLELFALIGLVSCAYGFAQVAMFISRNLHDWWQPEKWNADPFLTVFLMPTFFGRTLLGLGVPGRAASVTEAVAASIVSVGLFGATALLLVQL